MSEKKISVIISAKNALKGGLQSSSKSLKQFQNDYGRSLNSIEKKSDKTVKNVKKSWLSLRTVFASIAAIGFGKILASSVGSASKTVLKPVIEMENFKTQFKVLLGGLNEAEVRIRELNTFAAKTPFQIEGVMQASRQLEVMTKGALSTGKGLRMVGDIAAGTAKSSEDLSWQFKNVSLWVGRLYDGLKSGRPVGEAMMRLQEMGAVSGDVRNKIESLAKSGVSFEDVWSEFEQGTSRFNGLMKDQSATLGGILSNLQDVVTISLAELGDQMGKDLKPVLNEIIGEIEKLSKDGSIKEWGSEAAKVLSEVISVLKSTVSFFAQHGDKLVLGAKIFVGVKALKLALGLTRSLGGGLASSFGSVSKSINDMQVDKLNKSFSNMNIDKMQRQVALVKKDIMEINAIKGNDSRAIKNSKMLTDKRSAENKAIKEKERSETALLNKAKAQIKSEENQAKRKLNAEEALLKKAHSQATKEINDREKILKKEEALQQKAQRNAEKRLNQEKSANKQIKAADGQNRAADKQLKASGKNKSTKGDPEKLKRYQKEEYDKLTAKKTPKNLDKEISALAEKKHRSLVLDKQREEKDRADNKDLYDKKIKARAEDIRRENSLSKVSKSGKIHPTGNVIAGQKTNVAKSFNDSFNQKGVTRYKGVDEAGNVITKHFNHAAAEREKSTKKQATFLGRLNMKRQRANTIISNSASGLRGKMAGLGSGYDKLSVQMSQFAGVVALGAAAFGAGWGIGRGIAKVTGSDRKVEQIYNLATGFDPNAKDEVDPERQAIIKRAQDNARAINNRNDREKAQKENAEKRRISSDEYIYNRRFAERQTEVGKEDRNNRRNSNIDRELESDGSKHIGRDIKLKHELSKINEKIYDEEKLNQTGKDNSYILQRLEIQKASLESQIKYSGAVREVAPELVKELYTLHEQVKVIRERRKEVAAIQKLAEAKMVLDFEGSVDSIKELQIELNSSKEVSGLISKTWKNQVRIQEMQIEKENQKLKVKVESTNYDSLVSKELEKQSLELDYQLKKQQARKANSSEVLAIAQKQLSVQMNQKKEQLEILKYQIKSGALYKQIALSNKESKLRARAEAEINLKLKERSLISGKALTEESNKMDLSKRQEMVQDRILSRLEAQGHMTDRLISKNKELAESRKESLKSLEQESERLRSLDDKSFGEGLGVKRDSAKAKERYERGIARDSKRGNFSLDENGELQGKAGYSRLRREQIKNQLQRQRISNADNAQAEKSRISGMIDKDGFYMKDGRLRSKNASDASNGDRQKIKAALKAQVEMKEEESRSFKEQQNRNRKHRAHEAKVFGDGPTIKGESAVNKYLNNNGSIKGKITEAKKAAIRAAEKQDLKNDPAEIMYQSWKELQLIRENTAGSIGV